jgi:transcriptional regulator with XRE-family HTH domain
MSETAQPSTRFAANLTLLRKAADLSQEELSFRAAVHRTQISLSEGCHRMPRLDTLIKLAGALGVTLQDLMKGISWEPSVLSPGRFVVEPIVGEAGDD